MPSDWRSRILEPFVPNLARLTLVADPDGLLAEEGLRQAIQERGFEFLLCDDIIGFRYLFETHYREAWEQGNVHLVIPAQEAEWLDQLPFDLLQAGRRLSFSLGELFPGLSSSVLACLDRSDLDALQRAMERYKPGVLGEMASQDFVLRHLFQVAPELIQQPSHLLDLLIPRHYRGVHWPPMLDQRFIELLRQDNRFDDWPLESIIPDREAFFEFLQGCWLTFLDWQTEEGPELCYRVRERPFGTTGASCVWLPFEQAEVRLLLDNLFAEGLLKPVAHPRADRLAGTWMMIGIHVDLDAERTRRLDLLLSALEKALPGPSARHPEWLAFAPRWAELSVLWMATAPPSKDLRARYETVQQRLDACFQDWVRQRYAGLANQPPRPPVMLHHLPRLLAEQLSEKGSKVALVVVDGLAWDQWVVLRAVLGHQRPDWHCREQSVFAWMPTLTSVSRQAIFAGKPPFLFPDSIQTTDKEPQLWQRFWVDQGITAREILYLKGLGDGSPDEVREKVALPVRVAGLVVDKIDRIMHGMELGTAGMHNQVRQWGEHGWLAAVLDYLLDGGFRIFLTSDHGNVEAEGMGRPSEGNLADLRGERVRIYPNETLRERMLQKLPAAIPWPRIGLPDHFFPLLAPARCAFVKEGVPIVAHGGISVEELIVPLIQIERRGA